MMKNVLKSMIITGGVAVGLTVGAQVSYADKGTSLLDLNSEAMANLETDVSSSLGGVQENGAANAKIHTESHVTVESDESSVVESQGKVEANVNIASTKSSQDTNSKNTGITSAEPDSEKVSSDVKKETEASTDLYVEESINAKGSAKGELYPRKQRAQEVSLNHSIVTDALLTKTLMIKVNQYLETAGNGFADISIGKHVDSKGSVTARKKTNLSSEDQHTINTSSENMINIKNEEKTSLSVLTETIVHASLNSE